MGKPGVRHVPDDVKRKTVRAGVAFGLTQRQLCEMLGISLTTLEKHYRSELDTGSSEVVVSVASRLYKQALSTEDSMANTTARIYFLKARGGGAWRDVPPPDTDAPGQRTAPIVVMLPDNGRSEPALTLARPKLIEGDAVEVG